VPADPGRRAGAFAAAGDHLGLDEGFQVDEGLVDGLGGPDPLAGRVEPVVAAALPQVEGGSGVGHEDRSAAVILRMSFSAW